MGDSFYFIGNNERTIDNNKLIAIYVLNFDKKIVHTIYKKYSDELCLKLAEFQYFTDITQYISFNIKRDGKIALDIKL